MMNQEDIFKKIGQILNELNDQYQYLAQNHQELNELELELFLANASFLSDHVQIIRKLNNSAAQKILPEHTANQENQTVQEKPVSTQQPFKPALQDDIFKPDNEASNFEFILNEKTSDRFEFEEKPVNEIFDRPLSKEEALIIAQKQRLREKDSLATGATGSEEDEIGPEPFLVDEEPIVDEESVLEETQAVQVEEKTETEVKEAEQEVQEITEEKVEETEEEVQEAELEAEEKVLTSEEKVQAQPTPKPTLNDLLSSGNPSRSLYAENSRAAITDLKQAISLNDKLRYIKDLFNGYNLAYAEAIDLLNKMPDFKSAESFLQKNYAVKNNWSSRQETADQFYELLNQRFPAAK